MKKINAIVLILILTATAATAQFTKIGGGLALGSGFQFNNESGSMHRSGLLGASVKGIYEITLPLHVSPSFTYFLPHVTKMFNEKYVISSYLFDLNGHYVFNSLDKFEFYGLTGLNITLASNKVTFGSNPPQKTPTNKIGLNLGAGSYFKMTEQLDLYVEAKYIVSKYDQFMLNVGVLLNLQWLSKNENPGI